ncbi:serine/threonine protein kinase [Oscillochloris trichoides DG-6]|uniref:non-specific serine/threonine protein kinase n=1 Tax=Oscillochloris trichoides DG-6 TaxID=765420 RepID=E1IAB1_9CHLR|nr:serine/threonine-protein kinase [Oscillochloris trichoides]EFO81865.1 serine/threonine protein kinase [Oscillochloris trichoides DG-6]
MAEVTQILCPKCHKPNLRRARFCQHCGHDVVLNNHTPSDERRYVITRVIKQGGQGAVYEGIDDSGQIFAIKEMLDKFTDPKERTEAIDRFNAEAELLQGLNHPRIPRIYSHFTDEGRHYLTMDFIRGKDLEEIVEERGILSETLALEYADQICDVLVYLHGKGLIYRDMKPSNVMIEDSSGAVKLVDFGITKLFKPTERGTQIGTPGYAPPEQYQGLATPASDIYALGATLHHMLTGRDPTEQMPFDFPPANSINSSVSKRTSEALQRALQKVPQDRFATMNDFWNALRPERSRKPAQVRVAQPTVALPQQPAAQVGSKPAVAPAPVQPAPAPPPQPATPPSRPQPPPTPPPVVQVGQSKGNCLGSMIAVFSWMLVLLVIGAIGVGAYIYVARPAWADDLLAPISSPAPTSTPASLTSREFETDVMVQVSATANEAQIRTALQTAFLASARAQYGDGTLINMSAPPSPVGSAVQVGGPDANNMVTYQARMKGFIYTP